MASLNNIIVQEHISSLCSNLIASKELRKLFVWSSEVFGSRKLEHWMKIDQVDGLAHSNTSKELFFNCIKIAPWFTTP